MRVGDEVSRSDGARFRLSGSTPDGWTAERLDEFAPAVLLPERELRRDFTLDGQRIDDPSTPETVPEVDAWSRFGARIIGADGQIR